MSSLGKLGGVAVEGDCCLAGLRHQVFAQPWRLPYASGFISLRPRPVFELAVNTVGESSSLSPSRAPNASFRRLQTVAVNLVVCTALRLLLPVGPRSKLTGPKQLLPLTHELAFATATSRLLYWYSALWHLFETAGDIFAGDKRPQVIIIGCWHTG